MAGGHGPDGPKVSYGEICFDKEMLCVIVVQKSIREIFILYISQ